ncbi:DUF6522 family protein [uncultured Nitratireductor sp.]|uniref:DUF6522 family protein n=1 Tax=uncultured Nitratireductor sp. TaxID=520953 RepID=UPI0025E8774C|nr:DUF6522 family protein [uncultured Nitratireductor sp.]
MADDSVPVSFEDGGATVEAVLVADGLRLRADEVPSMLRDGSITCCFERGADKDEGRFRLTFWYQNLRFQLIVDEAGRVLQRLKLDYGRMGSRQLTNR